MSSVTRAQGQNKKGYTGLLRMWVHRLSNVDTEARTAVCAHCGPVPINRKGYSPNGRVKWRCALRHRANTNRIRVRNDRPYIVFKKARCEECGFVPKHLRQLDVHHKDGDHSNNAPENLTTLCANCHRLVHA